MSSRGTSRQQVAESRQWVNSYKAIKGCSRCGIKDHAVLDLHHEVSEHKVAPVSAMVAQNAPLRVIILEVLKCVVLCANCHRRLHFASLESTQLRKPLLTRLVNPFTEEVIE